MSNNKTWFVTGASKGLGLALVKKLISEGYHVAATSRKAEELKKAVGEVAPNSFLPLAVSLTDEASVQKAIQETISTFGSLDVVVNNAGFGLAGALEELSDAEARSNFDINVFGALNVIRHALPQMRKQGSGHILNISSTAGFTGAFAGFGIYCATKFAMHGFTESLHYEVAPFGIHTTLVLPGYFRTSFLESDSFVTPKREMPEYQNVRENQQLHEQQIRGNQPGDPNKAAEVLIATAKQEKPALFLFLGPDAYTYAEKKIAFVQADMNTQRELATSTNFD